MFHYCIHCHTHNALKVLYCYTYFEIFLRSPVEQFEVRFVTEYERKGHTHVLSLSE